MVNQLLTANRKTDAILAGMEKNLQRIYSRAQKEYLAKVVRDYDQYRAEEAILKNYIKALEKEGKVAEAATVKKSLEKFMKDKLVYGKHATAMTKALAEDYLAANRAATAYVNGQLPGIYALNYNAAGDFVATRLRGYSFELVDAATVKNLATTEKTLLPYKIVDGVKDVRWNTKAINSEILQGIIQGDSISDIAKRLENVTEMNRAAAVRNARTATTSAENKGRMDSLHLAEKKGIDLKKEWLATKDARTRETHKKLDGKQVGLDDEFLPGLEYPGDPNGDPGDVYNCRCTLITKVVGFRKV